MLNIKSKNKTAMDNENDDLDQKLKGLMAEACSAPKGGSQRNRCLTQVVELVEQSNRLHRYSSPCYPDARQETWFRVFRRPENYKPEKGGVIEWINSILYFRLKDQIKHDSDPPRILHSIEFYYNLLENIPDRPEIPPMLEVTLHWIKTDPQKLLRKTHLRHRPDVNAQLLLLERFPPESIWNLLADRLSVSRSTLAMFYERKCLPLLRKFGSDQGYL